MLSRLGSFTVLVGKDNIRDYRGAGLKRTTVTSIECVSASGEYLNPIVRYQASLYLSELIPFQSRQSARKVIRGLLSSDKSLHIDWIRVVRSLDYSEIVLLHDITDTRHEVWQIAR
ncbi:hypothetical protein PSV09DRAFT_2194946 [Bipolaris maydis]|nr:hypothetical protein PSV09DRAFT_2194946 [Bipolaris maydis]